MKVLLNCDLGEGEAAETTMAFLDIVDLANIACHDHAGYAETMLCVVCAARERGVQIGAHPGWTNRENLGQAAAEVAPHDLTRLLSGQIAALQRVLAESGVTLGHVKLHGLLYRLCDERTDLAEACVDWMEEEMEGVPLIVGAGGLLHAVAEARGVPLLREISAQRRYANEAELLPCGVAGALIDDPSHAARRIGEWRKTGFLEVADGKKWLVEAETVCLHADTPRSVEIARAVQRVLEIAEGAEG